MTIWNIKSRRYICVGTKRYAKEQGRVLIYGLQVKDNMYSLSCKGKYICRSEVSALCGFGHHLLASWDRTLHQIRINATTRVIEPIRSVPAGSDITNIATIGTSIYVSCKNGSISAFDWDAEKLKLTFKCTY